MDKNTTPKKKKKFNFNLSNTTAVKTSQTNENNFINNNLNSNLQKKKENNEDSEESIQKKLEMMQSMNGIKEVHTGAPRIMPSNDNYKNKEENNNQNISLNSTENDKSSKISDKTPPPKNESEKKKRKPKQGIDLANFIESSMDKEKTASKKKRVKKIKEDKNAIKPEEPEKNKKDVSGLLDNLFGSTNKPTKSNKSSKNDNIDIEALAKQFDKNDTEKINIHNDPTNIRSNKNDEDSASSYFSSDDSSDDKTNSKRKNNDNKGKNQTTSDSNKSANKGKIPVRSDNNKSATKEANKNDQKANLSNQSQSKSPKESDKSGTNAKSKNKNNSKEHLKGNATSKTDSNDKNNDSKEKTSNLNFKTKSTKNNLQSQSDNHKNADKTKGITQNSKNKNGDQSTNLSKNKSARSNETNKPQNSSILKNLAVNSNSENVNKTHNPKKESNINSKVTEVFIPSIQKNPKKTVDIGIQPEKQDDPSSNFASSEDISSNNDDANASFLPSNNESGFVKEIHMNGERPSDEQLKNQEMQDKNNLHQHNSSLPSLSQNISSNSDMDNSGRRNNFRNSTITGKTESGYDAPPEPDGLHTKSSAIADKRPRCPTPPPIRWGKVTVKQRVFRRAKTPPPRKRKPIGFILPPPNIVIDPDAVLALYGRGRVELKPLIDRMEKTKMLKKIIVFPLLPNLQRTSQSARSNLYSPPISINNLENTTDSCFPINENAHFDIDGSNQRPQNSYIQRAQSERGFSMSNRSPRLKYIMNYNNSKNINQNYSTDEGPSYHQFQTHGAIVTKLDFSSLNKSNSSISNESDFSTNSLLNSIDSRMTYSARSHRIWVSQPRTVVMTPRATTGRFRGTEQSVDLLESAVISKIPKLTFSAEIKRPKSVRNSSRRIITPTNRHNYI